VVFHGKTSRREFGEFARTGVDVENPAAGPALEVMVVAVTAEFVARVVAR
jgi:hypothetical protein